MSKGHAIGVDEETAAARETRAAELGISVHELPTETARAWPSLAPGKIAELDRQWQAIKCGEPTVVHDDVVRWLDTWGTPAFGAWGGQ